MFLPLLYAKRLFGCDDWQVDWADSINLVEELVILLSSRHVSPHKVIVRICPPERLAGDVRGCVGSNHCLLGRVDSVFADDSRVGHAAISTCFAVVHKLGGDQSRARNVQLRKQGSVHE